MRLLVGDKLNINPGVFLEFDFKLHDIPQSYRRLFTRIIHSFLLLSPKFKTQLE